MPISVQDPLALLSGSDDSDCGGIEAEQEQERFNEHSKRRRIGQSNSDANAQNQGCSSVRALPPAVSADPTANQNELATKPSKGCQPSLSGLKFKSKAAREADAARIIEADRKAKEEEARNEPAQQTQKVVCDEPPPALEIWQSKGSMGIVTPPWPSFHMSSRSSGSVVESGLPAALQGPLLERGLHAPTPLQSYAIPLIAAGRDLIGIAPSGSGKTLAYLLPCFRYLLRCTIGPSTQEAPSILILAPTRDLVCQIEQEARRFCIAAAITIHAVYGGVSKSEQCQGLRAQPSIVVATPGRLYDLIRTECGLISLKQIRYLIFDAADLMLGDGFGNQIREVVAVADFPKRQTILFSTSWPTPVQALAEEILKDPIEVRVGGNISAYSVSPNIIQDVIIVDTFTQKLNAFVSLLRKHPCAHTIVFVEKKRTCIELEKKSNKFGGKCIAIHADRSLLNRENAVAAFCTGEFRILVVTTDLARGGLEVAGVNLVVNYDAPHSAQEYINQVGRSGRGGVKGRAVSLLTLEDASAVHLVAEVMEACGVALPANLACLIKTIPPPCQGGKDGKAEVKQRFLKHGRRLVGKGGKIDPRCLGDGAANFGSKHLGRYTGEDLASAVRNLWDLPQPTCSRLT